jgi:crossover junction endodeoxyribonuclease RusA
MNKTSQEINFVIYAKPVAKARPRFGRGKVYTPKKTKDFEFLVKFEALKHIKTPMSGPVAVSILFFCKTGVKKLHGKFKDTRFDLDNGGKAILDALNGVAYADDGQVSVLTMQKRWYHKDAINIIISQLKEKGDCSKQSPCYDA